MQQAATVFSKNKEGRCKTKLNSLNPQTENFQHKTYSLHQQEHFHKDAHVNLFSDKI